MALILGAFILWLMATGKFNDWVSLAVTLPKQNTPWNVLPKASNSGFLIGQ